MKGHRYGEGTVFTAGSETLWIRYWVNGRSITENAHTTERRVAYDLLRRRIEAAKQGPVSDPRLARKLTVAHLYEALEREYKINKRKSLDDLEARWRLHLAPFFGFMLAANVSTDRVNAYIDSRQEQGASNASINRELAVLKRAFYLGQESTPPKIQSVPHFNMLKEDNVRKGFLDSDDCEKLARECARFGLWMRTAFEIGYTYGWRHSEVLGLRVSQISIADQVIRLNPGETKNDEAREVNLTTTLLQLLRECIRGKADDDFVLTRDNGKPVLDFRGAWESATTKAGKQGLLFHDMRRTAIRNMVRAGISEKVAMQISGHKTRSVFDRYNITNQADVKEAVSRLDRQKTVRVEAEIEPEEGSTHTSAARPN